MLYQKKNQKRKGQALLEYALLIAGVALICLAAVSILGHKTSDMIGAVAATIPGAHADDNGTIASGKLIETAANANGDIALDAAGIATLGAASRLGNNVLGGETGNDAFAGLVNEANGD